MTKHFLAGDLASVKEYAVLAPHIFYDDAVRFRSNFKMMPGNLAIRDYQGAIAGAPYYGGFIEFQALPNPVTGNYLYHRGRGVRTMGCLIVIIVHILSFLY